MIADANTFAENDKKAKEKIEAKNGLEAYVATIERTVGAEDFKTKVSEKSLQKISESITELKQWIEDNEEDATKEAYEDKYKEFQNLILPFMKVITGGILDEALNKAEKDAEVKNPKKEKVEDIIKEAK